MWMETFFSQCNQLKVIGLFIFVILEFLWLVANLYYVIAATPECSCCEAEGACMPQGCTLCPSGYFQDKPGQNTCNACKAGTTSKEGAQQCSPCPVGSFAKYESLMG
jgi:hypothetical protein